MPRGEGAGGRPSHYSRGLWAEPETDSEGSRACRAKARRLERAWQVPKEYGGARRGGAERGGCWVFNRQKDTVPHGGTQLRCPGKPVSWLQGGTPKLSVNRNSDWLRDRMRDLQEGQRAHGKGQPSIVMQWGDGGTGTPFQTGQRQEAPGGSKRLWVAQLLTGCCPRRRPRRPGPQRPARPTS